MTTEDKALALVNEVARERGSTHDSVLLDRAFVESEALCRAIEQREATKQELSAFRQKVSDIVHDYVHGAGKKGAIDVWESLKGLIIPTPKPDPLLEAMKEAGWSDRDIHNAEPSLRAALDALGYEIREKGETK